MKLFKSKGITLVVGSDPGVRGLFLENLGGALRYWGVAGNADADCSPCEFSTSDVFRIQHALESWEHPSIVKGIGYGDIIEESNDVTVAQSLIKDLKETFLQ